MIDKILNVVKSVFSDSQKNSIPPKDDREEVNRRLRIISKYKQVYETNDGKEVINDILNLCSYGQLLVGRDPNETYFKLGEQNIGIEIVQRLTADLSAMEESDD